MLLTAVGVQVEPEMQQAILTIGLCVVGLIGVGTKEKIDE